eukprot:9241941-Alexandrium_andersonii.AAC.1
MSSAWCGARSAAPPRSRSFLGSALLAASPPGWPASQAALRTAGIAPRPRSLLGVAGGPASLAASLPSPRPSA